MERLTRIKDKYPCRINDCPLDDWIRDLVDYETKSKEYESLCETCPFMTYINRLAEYEDKEENNEK